MFIDCFRILKGFIEDEKIAFVFNSFGRGYITVAQNHATLSQCKTMLYQKEYSTLVTDDMLYLFCRIIPVVFFW